MHKHISRFLLSDNCAQRQLDRVARLLNGAARLISGGPSEDESMFEAELERETHRRVDAEAAHYCTHQNLLRAQESVKTADNLAARAILQRNTTRREADAMRQRINELVQALVDARAERDAASSAHEQCERKLAQVEKDRDALGNVATELANARAMLARCRCDS